MMRRRRRRKATWAFADAGSLVNGPAGTLQIASLWLLPPARAQFIMNTKQRSSLTFAGAHLWLDFQWKITGANVALPDVDFGIFRTDMDQPGDIPDVDFMNNQWTVPSTPASITSWNEDDEDGTEAFLWQHHIKGMSPPGIHVSTDGDAQVWNQVNVVGGSTLNDGAPAYVCRKGFVTQEWQPDVVVRSKRRLMKGDGICIAMASTPPANCNVQCNVHWRVLTS